MLAAWSFSAFTTAVILGSFGRTPVSRGVVLSLAADCGRFFAHASAAATRPDRNVASDDRCRARLMVSACATTTITAANANSTFCVHRLYQPPTRAIESLNQ